MLCFGVVEDFSQHSVQLFQVVHRAVHNRYVVCQGWQRNGGFSLHLFLSDSGDDHALWRNSLACLFSHES